MATFTVGIGRDALKKVYLDCLLATSTNLDRSRSQVRDQIEVAHEDGIDTKLDAIDLLSGLRETCLEDQCDEFVNVVFSNFLLLSADTQHNLTSV